MTDLPRSRALVRLDGPGHIMPIEPVTPPDSATWRILHMPATLAAGAVSLLVVAAIALNPVGLGVRLASEIPGARYLVPVIGAAAMVTLYWAFVRTVERRRDLEEFDTRGWLAEFALGLAGGLVLSVGTFALLGLFGCIRVLGLNPLRVMLLPLVVQLGTAVLLEVVLCGLFFRLVERLLGSWITLLLTMTFFGAVRLVSADPTPFAVLAVALEAGLLFAVLFMATRRLWAPIGLHATWKLGQVGLYGVAMSPSGPHGLVVSRVVGPDWLTGGSAGTIASIPGLALDALVVIGLLTVAVRRGQIVRPAWQRGRVRKAEQLEFS